MQTIFSFPWGDLWRWPGLAVKHTFFIKERYLINIHSCFLKQRKKNKHDLSDHFQNLNSKHHHLWLYGKRYLENAYNLLLIFLEYFQLGSEVLLKQKEANFAVLLSQWQFLGKCWFSHNSHMWHILLPFLWWNMWLHIPIDIVKCVVELHKCVFLVFVVPKWLWNRSVSRLARNLSS